MPHNSNPVVLVTGAARGIGAAVAEAFAADGARVVVADLDAAGAQACAARLGAEALTLDVREELAWIGAIAALMDRHGRLDVLVNNAGITGLDGGAPQDPEHAALEDWQAVLRTNLDGVFLGCKHGLRAMRRQRRGAIVNIGSRSAFVGVPGAAAYAASKAAVDAHTRSVALHAAAEGLAIRCNAVHPGAVLTPLWEPMLGDAQGPDRAQRLAELAADTPLGRLGQPAEVAAAVRWLASDEAAYVTGASLSVDGGLGAGRIAPKVR